MFVDNSTPVGKFFVSAANSSVASPITLIASNVNGLIIRTMQISNAQSGASIVIYADTAPPSTTWDSTKRAIFCHQADDYFPASIPYPLTIPAGLNIYCAYTGSQGTNIILTYDLVTI